ncbi:hypothetical protein LZ31DRAFT_273744 [Colletotrichum somersetense]|nr:hypothetical protein LZ31DRAFT_273744 [Colletotrichum somersetense]
MPSEDGALRHVRTVQEEYSCFTSLAVGTCMTVTCCRSLQGVSFFLAVPSLFRDFLNSIAGLGMQVASPIQYCHSIKGTIAKCIVTQIVYGKVCVNKRRRLMLDTCVCALRIHSLLCKLGLPSGLRVGAATQVLFFIAMFRRHGLPEVRHYI